MSYKPQCSTAPCDECGRDWWPMRKGLCQTCYQRHRSRRRRAEPLSGLGARLLGPATYYRDQALRCRETGYPRTAETYDELAAMADRAGGECAA